MCYSHILYMQLAYVIMDPGRGTLVTGVLKMVSSHSGRLLNVTSNTSKENSWALPVAVATVVVG